MATVYSLVCWGGRTGKTVTLTIASPCVITSSYHGLRDGTGVVFISNGDTLPTGLVAGTAYYSKSTGVSTFNLYSDSALTTVVNTSGSQAGTHILQSLYRYALTTDEKARYGSAGSERIYDGIRSFDSARAPSTLGTQEFCELGMAFNDVGSAGFTLGFTAGSVTIASTVDGARSSAFHDGVIGAGYAFENRSSGTVFVVGLTAYRITLDGFTVLSSAATVANCVTMQGTQCSILNMIARATGTATSGTAITPAGALCSINNCIAIGHYRGYISGSVYGYSITNSIATKCTIGFGYNSTTGQRGFYYNNISVGNTTNWQTQPTLLEGAGYNAGGSGDSPWYIGTNTSLTVATSDFMDWTNNDLSPRAYDGTYPATMDVGYAYYGMPGSDITDGDRPNYNNGGSEGVDLGPFEYDNGYGPHPASHTLTLTNVVVGSRILIRDQADTTTHYSADAAASTVVVSITVYADSRDNWRIRIRKATTSTFYQPFETLMTATAGESNLYISQIPDE